MCWPSFSRHHSSRATAWTAARRLFDEHYRDVVIVSIATTGTTDCAFSADTGMAEVLVVATRKSGDEETGGTTLFVNLQRRPHTILEAVTVARSVQRIPTLILSVGTISIGSGRESRMQYPERTV